MKKQYLSPSLKVFETKLDACLLAGSDISATVENEEFDAESMTSLSRGGNNIWDDDDSSDFDLWNNE